MRKSYDAHYDTIFSTRKFILVYRTLRIVSSSTRKIRHFKQVIGKIIWNDSNLMST